MCIRDRDTAWHCGAKSYKHGSCRNANSIGIEMCCTAGNYRISDRTKENAAYLCAFLCKMLGIGAGGVDSYVLRHYDVTGKNCPAQMVSNPTEWQEFKNKVKGILGGSVSAGGQQHTAQPTTDNVASYKVKITADAVSYTHLDVYKRQELSLYFRERLEVLAKLSKHHYEPLYQRLIP